MRKHSEIGVFILVETHWSFTNDYQSEGWLLVHSGVPGKKGAGILVGIRSDLADRQDLKWHEVEPGRLLHVRCRIRKQQYDLLAVYQHALTRGDKEQQAETMKKCGSIWKKMDKTLSGFPFRSALVLAGDFNMVLSPLTDVSGKGIKLGSDLEWLRTERAEVMSILQARKLVALNTWGKPAITYHHPNGESQIDYIMTRRQTADLEARKCSPVKTPLAGWRSAGHLPVIASLKLNWKPWQQHLTGRSDSSAITPSLETIISEVAPDLQQFQQAVKHNLDEKPRKIAMPQPRVMDSEVEQIWSQSGAVLERALLQPSDLETQRRERKRAMRKLARQRRRDALKEMLGLIGQAQDAGNAHAQYQFIRKVCPKAFRRKICLKTESGGVMSNEAECDALAAYAKTLFDDKDFTPPELLPLPMEWFTSESWQAALGKLNVHKAVPKFSASVQCWKQHAHVLAPTLQRIAHSALCDGKPYVPDFWTRVQLAWLPKPGRAPTSPAQLRSIGLMSPDTKAFLQILKQQASPWVQKALAGVPQYAYRQLSSTTDPILRATHHCTTVRRNLAGYVEDHTAKILNHSDKELLGGLMLSIDLSKAFDYLSYGEMFESLQNTGMPEALSRVLIHIHIQTTLHVEHGGHGREVKMKRGLRQGCGVAPMIYACWTAKLCKAIDQELHCADDVRPSTATWTQSHMSIFADDKHCFWDIQSSRDFERAVRSIHTILGVIAKSGMVVNLQKSMAVLALKGSKAQHIINRYTKYWNGDKCLVIRSAENDIRIPIASSMIYLGVVLSYGQFELATARHRCMQAGISFGQLKNVLRVNGVISKARRLKIYITCVWPSLLYGISAVGVTHSALRAIQSTASMQLRKILRIHDKGWSNVRVLQQADLVPVQHLQRCLDKQAGSLLQDTDRHIALRQLEESRLRILLEQLQLVQTQSIGQSLTQADTCTIVQLPCPVCGIYFGSAEGLHQHLHRQHADVEQASKIQFNRAAHSLFGLPYCRFCRKRLGTWQSLTKHITQGTCLRVKLAVGLGQSIEKLLEEIQMEEARDPPQPPAGDPQAGPRPADAPDVREIIESTPAQHLAKHSAMLISHAAQCLLCGQRLKQSHRMKAHWQFSHAAAWGKAHYHAESKAQSLSAIMRQPCEYCGSKAKNSKEHAKKCPMLFQALAIQHLRTMNTSLTQGDDLKPVAPRKTEAAPKYKAFVSPLETAFNKGSHRDTKVKWSSPTQSTTSSAAPKPAALPIRTIADMQQAKENAGTIKQFFQQRPDVGAEMRPSSTYGAPWYCRLKLQNAGAMCYLNAGLLALLHAINQTAQVPEELRFIQKLGNNAAERGIALSLSRMNGIRKLAPNWVFSAEQKDAAELLHEMFSHMRDLQVIWDTRAATVEGVRLRTQGTLPIPVPMPYTRDSVSLQEILTAWSCAGDEATALVASAELVCVQLGRYHPQGKSFGIVDMPETLQLPVFQDDSSIQWINYTITGAIIHLGRSPTTGHYRALLKVRHSWWLTDDNREAEGINLHDGHHRNVYLIFMRRSGDEQAERMHASASAGF